MIFNIKQRVRLTALLLGTAAAVMLTSPVQAATKPNIVVIMGDDIGKRPILAFGNSDHDMQMIEYTMAGEGRRLGLFVHHTDADREYAYDRESHVGALDKALDQADGNGWIVVDMTKDWKKVFPGK